LDPARRSRPTDRPQGLVPDPSLPISGSGRDVADGLIGLVLAHHPPGSSAVVAFDQTELPN
jgi:hypothetical protein